MRAVILPLFAMLLTGCAALPTPLKPPAELLICEPAPEPPRGNDGRSVAAFVLRLSAAGEDCRNKLGSLRQLFGIS